MIFRAYMYIAVRNRDTVCCLKIKENVEDAEYCGWCVNCFSNARRWNVARAEDEWRQDKCDFVMWCRIKTSTL